MRSTFTLLVPIILIALFAFDREGGEHDPRKGEVGSMNFRSAQLQSSSSDESKTESSRLPSSRLLLGNLDPLLTSALNRQDRVQLADYLEVLQRPGGSSVSWCWSPETSEAKLAAFAAAEQMVRREREGLAPLANQFLEGGRWRTTAVDGLTVGRQGDPIVVTWSIVPDGTLVPGTGGNPDQGSDLRSWLQGIYGGSVSGPVDAQPWFGLFEEAFAAMAGTCGVEFRFESNDDGATLSVSAPGELGVRGDVRIGTRFLDGNGGLLGISFGPDEGDMVLDSGDALLALTGDDSLRLVNTLTHEIGHCLGLAHVCPINQTKLMEPNLSTAFRGPRFDEFQSLQRLYGDPLEMSAEARDNDSVLDASPVEVIPAEQISLPRLSIDDSSDEDFFKVDLLNGQRIQVEVVPGEGIYHEGGETPQGCSSGSLFDSTSIHDLKVEIYDRDGETVLESADLVGPGEIESTTLLEVPRNGSYFVRVAGSTANAAQLYELRVQLEPQLPGPRLVLGKSEVLAESGVTKNGRPDPGESVRVRIPLINEGVDATNELSVQAIGSSNVTFFSQEGPASLTGGEVGGIELVFGADGVCGDDATIDLAVSDLSGELVSGSFLFSLGELLSPVPLEENFDGGVVLPEDWQSSQSGTASGWVTSSSRSHTPLRSAFTGGPGSVGESFLISPPVVLGSSGGTLEFRHLYRTEVGFDGGVLEVSRNGGEWVDALTGSNFTVTGGYDRTIREGFGSSIAGQQAWSGRLNSFLETSVVLPASWAGETVRFRWRFVSDQSGISEGWWVDTVRFEMQVDDCIDHQPGLSLHLLSGGLDENYPTREALLELRSELPLLEAVSVSLLASGSAGPGDYSGQLSVTLPAGETALSIPLQVVADGLDEGTETLVIEIPDTALEFAPVDPASITLEIGDRTHLDEWAASFPVPVDLAADQDGDGFSGLGEYLLGTNPTDQTSRVSLDPVILENGILLPTGLLPERDDAVLGVEGSSNLVSWQPVSFVTTSEGILVSRQGGESFLRLTFTQEQ